MTQIGRKPMTEEVALQKMLLRMEDKYSLVEFKWTGQNGLVTFNCHEHGDFEVVYRSATAKTCKCPLCKRNRSNYVTTELAKERLISKFGDALDFSKVEMDKSVHTEIIITCKTHGEIRQSFSKTMRSKYGCVHCGNTIKSSHKRQHITDVLDRFRGIHGDTYDYSLFTEFKSVDSKVKILCKDHGLFCQTPAQHLLGSGCPKCSDISSGHKIRVSADDFKSRATAIHGELYEYDLSTYEKLTSKVKIKCKTHGWFWQIGSDHTVSKAGCPTCSAGGFDINSSGYLYLLVGKEGIVKIGITNRAVSERVRELNRDGTDFKIVNTFKADGKFVVEAEKQLKLDFSEMLYKGDEKFAGYTECFIPEAFSKVLSGFLSYKFLT